MLRAAALLALATVALAPAPSYASRKATSKERAAILAAIHRRQSGCRGYPPGHCVEVVHVSTQVGTWAAVYLKPAKRAYRYEVQADVATLHRNAGRWRVHQVGNGGGCRVPAAVQRDLKLACY